MPSVILDEDGNMIDSHLPSGEPLQFVFEEINWQQELNWEEAAQRLEVAMYPFKKVSPGGCESQGQAPWRQGRGHSRWTQSAELGTRLPAELPPCRPSQCQWSLPLPSEVGGGIPWLSSTPARKCTRAHSQTQPPSRSLAAQSSFSLSRLGFRSPTCHSPRPSTKPRPRTSWCTQSCCGGPWTTSPAEVREPLPV